MVYSESDTSDKGSGTQTQVPMNSCFTEEEIA